MGIRIPLRPVSRSRLAPVAVLAAGALAMLVVSAAHAMPGRDTLHLFRVAAAGGLVAGLGGWLTLWVLRQRSTTAQIVAVVLTSIVAIGLGTWLAAREMFFSTHDAAVLEVVLVGSATAGLAVATGLGTRVQRSTAGLVDQARHIGAGARAPSQQHAPSELARLSTELDEMAERLDESRRRERALDESRRQLIAWVSHDLRTPLAGIRALAEALEDEVVDDPETIRRYHRTMREEADRLAGLVDDLFELSRAQAGVLKLEFQRVSLGDLVSDALAGVAPLAEAKRVRLEGRLTGPPLEVECSAPEVLRALRNILENAIRHTPSDGTVVVEVGGEGEGAFVSVLDSGGGIPGEDLERIFETAYRGDPARTPRDGGAGLGLSIAKEFVEAHRGEITVRNEGEGCRFTVRIPTGSDA